jgi:phosphatidylinositol alpha 1,6-mannosyltransferase
MKPELHPFGPMTQARTDGLSWDAEGLRLALFSGNYNCVRDGANQALNRLVAYLERRGARVRIYSPTAKDPAFEPTGTLVSVPSIPVPFRPEYRLALGLTRRALSDLEAFGPTIVHLSAPDLLGHAAQELAVRRGIPIVASVHTRFEAYLKYYRLGGLESPAKRCLTRFYNRCRHVYVPSDCMARQLRADGVSSEIRAWSRGVDRALFDPARRDFAWRRALGIADDETVVAFVGRLVLEKGLEPFVDALELLKSRELGYRVLIAGDGPARDWLEARLPGALYLGHLTGVDLARAYASADIFFNPSSTEAFGNVTVEAMASGLPTVCANATGSSSIVRDRITGFLVEPASALSFSEALRCLLADSDLRRRMGAAGRRASAVFDWDTVLSGVVDHYRDALVERPAPSSLSPMVASLPVAVSSPLGKWFR